MKVVYIAGPFTAATSWDIECNVRRAEAAGLEVAHLGVMPLIPHANTRFFHGQLGPEFWYDGTAELLLRCDAALFLDGWSVSTGCGRERELCREHRLPAFFAIGDLAHWLKTGIL